MHIYRVWTNVFNGILAINYGLGETVNFSDELCLQIVRINGGPPVTIFSYQQNGMHASYPQLQFGVLHLSQYLFLKLFQYNEVFFYNFKYINLMNKYHFKSHAILTLSVIT